MLQLISRTRGGMPTRTFNIGKENMKQPTGYIAKSKARPHLLGLANALIAPGALDETGAAIAP